MKQTAFTKEDIKEGLKERIFKGTPADRENIYNDIKQKNPKDAEVFSTNKDVIFANV